MPLVACPECDEDIRIPGKPRLGQKVTCPRCVTLLEVIGLDPVELDWIFEDETDEFDDEDEEEVDGESEDPDYELEDELADLALGDEEDEALPELDEEVAEEEE